MEGKSLVIGATYLYRLGGRKQIPVRFSGRAEPLRNGLPSGYQLLILERIDGSETYYRRYARALSKHFDSCALGRESCDCAARLAALSKTV